jgi:hypothetical protein
MKGTQHNSSEVGNSNMSSSTGSNMSGANSAEVEQQDGLRWILGAGIAAVLIASFVAWSDHTLSTSTSEQELGERLRELRTAQTSLSTTSEDAGGLDPRQGARAMMREPAAPAILAAGAKPHGHGTHGHGDKGHGETDGHTAPAAQH